MQRLLQEFEVIKYSGFEITKKHSNCILICDDSCEGIFNDKELVKIATSGRHREIHVIYVKHNLFNQIKCSWTIYLITTHIFFVQVTKSHLTN